MKVLEKVKCGNLPTKDISVSADQQQWLDSYSLFSIKVVILAIVLSFLLKRPEVDDEQDLLEDEEEYRLKDDEEWLHDYRGNNPFESDGNWKVFKMHYR